MLCAHRRRKGQWGAGGARANQASGTGAKSQHEPVCVRSAAVAMTHGAVGYDAHVEYVDVVAPDLDVEQRRVQQREVADDKALHIEQL